jgi:sugar phosphate isomerase/epimerase
VELCLYTDCVSNLPFDEALDLAAGLDVEAVEIAAGDRSSLPPERVLELVDDPAALVSFQEMFRSRGMRVAAVNCTAWAFGSTFGDELSGVLKACIRLAHALGVDKIVTASGCPGTPPTIRAIEWMTLPWPRSYFEDLDAQWNEGVELWKGVADFAGAHGIRSIALELHPLQLVSNAPTLQRFRAQVGPVIGASIDPSTMFWQRMDPIRVIHALGPAVHHVHLKDVEVHDDQLAVSGAVLTTTPFEEPRQRAWTYRTVGFGRDADFWSPLIEALHDVGYRDVVSVANKDPYLPQEMGANLAARFVSGLLSKNEQQVGHS